MGQIKVSKVTESELKQFRDFINELESVVEEHSHWEDDLTNKEIADVAKKLPSRLFLIAANLGILLDNYQDKKSEVLEHPKWIMGLYEKIDYLESISKSCSINWGYFPEQTPNYTDLIILIHPPEHHTCVEITMYDENTEWIDGSKFAIIETSQDEN